MKIKKAAIILLVCHLVGFGIVFGVRKFRDNRKEEKMSVTSLSEQKNVQPARELESENDNVQVVQDELLVPAQGTETTALDTEKKIASDVKNESQKKDIAKKTETVPVETTSESKKSSGDIKNDLVSWGFQKATNRKIKAIIVHTSYNALGGDVFDFDKVLQEWKDAGVAPHYAIEKDGTIHQLVADNNIAWHAGVSKLPDGTTDVNGASIGVEVVNSKDAKFSTEQYSALNGLISTLKKKYQIKYILGHDEIAAGRKTDPWGIDWNKVNR
ncbi:MAG: N-acetylmuramoyl-L-alanine amidase [bacterium]